MNAWGYERVQRVIGNLLLLGVVLAAAMVLTGGVLYLRGCGGTVPDYGLFRGEPPELRSVTGIAREDLSLNPPGMIRFGLLLLIATPLARVVFSVAVFALQRDVIFAAATLFVLLVVLFGTAREGPNTVVPPERYRLMCIASDASSRAEDPDLTPRWRSITITCCFT